MLKCISMDPIWIPFRPQQLKFWTPAWYSPVVRDSSLLCVPDLFCLDFGILVWLHFASFPFLAPQKVDASSVPPHSEQKLAKFETKGLKQEPRLTFVVNGYAANVAKTHVSWHHVLMSSPICYIYLFPPHAWH